MTDRTALPERPRDLPRFLRGLSGVDDAGAHARADALRTRSLKAESKVRAVDLAISMLDLTTLEGTDTSERVRSLAAKALHPDPLDLSTPSVAAVCVFPDRVADVRAVVGDRLHVASVSTAFPSGRASLNVKLLDTREAIEAGADEIDMVIDRAAILSGQYDAEFDTIAAIRDACGPDVHLKVILETGELGSLDTVKRASWLAMLAGADMIKTSTGKIPVGATPASVLVMLQAVRDFREATGRLVGVKASGGVRTAKEALGYLVIVNETVGPDWLTPDAFRFGASTLLTDLVMQRQRLATGHYSSPAYISCD